MSLKQLFIDQITAESGKVVTAFMVGECAIKQTKKGDSYAALTLQDRTGSISARLWDHYEPFQVGTLLKVEATASEYRDELQLTIGRWRLATSEECTVEDFIPSSTRDRDEMLKEIWDQIALLINPDLVRVVTYLAEKYGNLLRDAPAAKGNHQPYLGGLSEHILSLCNLARNVGRCYSDKLNVDLLVAAAILHDLGKVKELSFDLAIGYTRRGSLTGHIGLGLQMLGEAVLVYCGTHPPPEIIDHLEHIIASHHGRLEWGAIVEPMSREAHVFHQLDMIDSAMGKFDQIKGTGVMWDKGQRFYVPEPEAEESHA